MFSGGGRCGGGCGCGGGGAISGRPPFVLIAFFPLNTFRNLFIIDETINCWILSDFGVIGKKITDKKW